MINQSYQVKISHKYINGFIRYDLSTPCHPKGKATFSMLTIYHALTFKIKREDVYNLKTCETT